MTILNITRATRDGAHLLISLFGPPESGKTLSALLLAAGIEPDPAKRILLDTEAGRGRLYAEEIPGGYQYAELTRPFTPERYVEALLEIEAGGFTVCVVDSVSHGWAGEGGVLDQANALEKAGKKGDQIWRDPKVRYRSLSNRLLGSQMHLILCSRAKQPLIDGPPDRNGKPTKVRGPWVEIQERMLRYEMTAVLQMTKRGEFVVEKCPGPLEPVFNVGGLVGAEMGQRIVSWVGGNKARDLALDALKAKAEEVAGDGADAFRAFWKGVTAEERTKLKPFLGNYESIARAADADAERARQMQKDAATNLDDPFGGQSSAAGEQPGAHPTGAEDLDGDFPDDSQGGQAFVNAVMRVLNRARSDEELDVLLATPKRKERLAWLEERSPTLHKGVMDYIEGRRAQLREAA